MKAHDFISEIPMNPSAYMRSLSKAQQLGIMVGFEFEICCKPRIAKAWHSANKKAAKEQSFLDMYPPANDWYKDLGLADVGEIFEADPKAMRKLSDGYTSQWYAYVHYKLAKYFEKPVTAFLDKVKAADPALYKELQDEIKESVFKGITGQVNTIRRYDSMPWSDGKKEQKLEKLGIKEVADPIKQAAETFPEDLFVDIFGSTDFNKAKRTLGLHIPADDYNAKTTYAALILRNGKLAEKLENEELEAEDMWDDHNNYGYYRKPIAQAIRDGLGVNVDVFTQYHQKSKTWDRWYVEPDNSVEATNPEDGIAEIVSPPIFAAQALETLDKFYGIAKANGFYTNESTGLHINVSLPKDTDILKLALLVGDDYVLKTFDREDNEYAMSVYQELKGGGGAADDEYGDKIAKARKFKNKERYFGAMARGIMGAHCSSITIGPGQRYVSFRGVGGSYLDKKKEVTESLGRFIRAMTIASDPTEYRKEYLNKLSRLIARFEPQKKEPFFSSNMTGVAALSLIQYSQNTNKNVETIIDANLEKLKEQVMQRYGQCIFAPIHEAQAAGILKGIPDAPDTNKPDVIATAKGFIAVPATEQGQLKMVGGSKGSIDDAAYQIKQVSDASGKRTGRVIATAIGFVPKGHKDFGRLIKSVIMGLKK